MDNARWISTTSSPTSMNRFQEKSAPSETQYLARIPLTKPALQSLNVPLEEDKVMKWASNDSLESLMTDIDCSPADSGPPQATVSFTNVAQPPCDRLFGPQSTTSVPPTPPQWLPYLSNAAPKFERHHSEPARGPLSTPEVCKQRKPVVAMPGTMSSRPIGIDLSPKQRKRGNGRQPNSGSRENKAPALGTRVRYAFRDIFHKSPVNGKSFERIEDKHWSDDW